MLAAALTATAKMQTVDDEAMAEVQASMGARFDFRGARAVSGAWGIQDINGAPGFGPYGANGNRGYLFYSSVAYSAAGGTAGNINLWNWTLDIASYNTTEMLVIGFPTIDGRITINDIRIGNANDNNAYWSGPFTYVPATTWNSWPSTGGSPVGSIYLEDVTFVEGSGIMMWGH